MGSMATGILNDTPMQQGWDDFLKLEHTSAEQVAWLKKLAEFDFSKKRMKH